jgi:hypothetical protein
MFVRPLPALGNPFWVQKFRYSATLLMRSCLILNTGICQAPLDVVVKSQ